MSLEQPSFSRRPAGCRRCAASSWSPATNATRTTNGSGAIASMIRWAGETLTARRRAAPNWLRRHTALRSSAIPMGRSSQRCAQAMSSAEATGAPTGWSPTWSARPKARSPARIRNPRNVRPWQHVLEPVRGYLMLAARLIDTGTGFAGGWNFGSDRDAAVDVVTLADLVVEKWNGSAPLYVVEKRANEPPESVVLRLDSTKSYVELGWKPLLTIGEAVSMTVEWHLRYQRDPECDTAVFAAADRRVCRGVDRKQRERLCARTPRRGLQHACELRTSRLRRGRNRRRRRRYALVNPDGRPGAGHAGARRVAVCQAPRHHGQFRFVRKLPGDRTARPAEGLRSHHAGADVRDDRRADRKGRA